MKLGKAKILFSTFSLIAALALAVFTVYAWFTTNETVTSNNINAVVTSGDVLSCEFDFYYTKSESIDETKSTITYTIDGKISKNEFKLPDYENGRFTPTAVLMDMKIRFSVTGDFKITARAKNGKEVYNKNDFDEYIGKNLLTNVIYLRKVTSVNPGYGTNNPTSFTVAEDAEHYNFITQSDEDGNKYDAYFDSEDDIDKKNSYVSLPKVEVTDADIVQGSKTEYELHVYYVIDYMPMQITSLYFIMLKLFPSHATLDTPIQFLNDIYFEIDNASKD